MVVTAFHQSKLPTMSILAMVLCSCAVFTTKPPSLYVPPTTLQCDTSYAGAIVDAALSVVLLIGTISLVATADNEQDTEAALPVVIAVAAAFGTSAYFGRKWVGTCRDHKRTLDNYLHTKQRRKLREPLQTDTSRAVTASLAVESSTKQPVGSTSFDKRIQPEDGLTRFSYQAKLSEHSTLELWVTQDDDAVVSNHMGISLSFSATEDPSFVDTEEIVLLADGATLIPIPAVWPVLPEAMATRDVLVGKVKTSTLLSLADAQLVVLRIQGKEIRLPASATRLLREYLVSVRGDASRTFNPLQMRPRN